MTPIHTMCQGKNVTVGDVKKWVNSLVSTLSLQASDTNNSQTFFEEVKTAAGDLRIDQPQPLRLPRNARMIVPLIQDNQEIEYQIQQRYVGIYKQVSECEFKTVDIFFIIYPGFSGSCVVSDQSIL